MRKMLILAVVVLSALWVSGCGPWQITECKQMTDGGVLGRQFDDWQREDEFVRADFKPQLERWWKGEKAKFPKFKNTCGVDAAKCYDNYEEEALTTKK